MEEASARMASKGEERNDRTAFWLRTLPSPGSLDENGLIVPILSHRAILPGAVSKNRHDQSVSSPISALAVRVRARRKDLRLTQRALADLAGCSTRFLRELEK